MNSTVPSPRFDVGGVLLPRPFKIGRFGHFGLYVDDVLKTSSFYRDVLGFRQTDRLPGSEQDKPPRGMFLAHGADHHSLVLIDSAIGASRNNRPARGITINQMSYQVGSLDEVINAYHYCLDRGIKIWRVGRDVPGSNWALYFEDPDENMLELYYGMEQIGWDRRSKPDGFVDFKGVGEPPLPQPPEFDEILRAESSGRDANGGFRSLSDAEPGYNVSGIMLPRPFKIVKTGPVTLCAQDFEVSLRFYTEHLGLLVTEQGTVQGHPVAFLRYGTDHHNVVLVPIALRRALGLSEHSTLLSLGLQMGSYSQLKGAVAYLREKGIRFLDSNLADLHAGIDYSAYAIDPDGHCLQLYYYMEQVGWDGRPRNRDLRRPVTPEWPDAIEPLSDTYADRTFQGPLG
jgi:catechol 2,3-dioxygenase-like lactoylglutathione lyase family enzyme